MGVCIVIVVINKMDAVGFAHIAFEEFAGGVRAAAARFDLDDVTVIPVSALTGDNVIDASEAMPWYHGPTVMTTLTRWRPRPDADRSAAPFRLPVQYVVRADDFRGYAGTVVSGVVRPGDKVVVNASGPAATVERIVTYEGDIDEARAGQAVTLTLETETDVTRGDLLVAKPDGASDKTFPRPATAFAADLVWTGEEELRHGRSYLLVAGSMSVPAVVTAIRGRRDVVSGEEMAGRTLKMNDIGHVEIATDTPVPLDAYELSRDTGGFLLVERVSRDTVAAGLVRHALRRAHNVVPHAFTVDRDARSVLKGQRPRVLWLTGLPGAGKSTIADALERKLFGMGLHTYVLDGDGVRTGLNRDLGSTPEDRAENVRRVAETAKLMLDAGLIVVVVAHDVDARGIRRDRAAAREAGFFGQERRGDVGGVAGPEIFDLADHTDEFAAGKDLVFAGIGKEAAELQFAQGVARRGAEQAHRKAALEFQRRDQRLRHRASANGAVASLGEIAIDPAAGFKRLHAGGVIGGVVLAVEVEQQGVEGVIVAGQRLVVQRVPEVELSGGCVGGGEGGRAGLGGNGRDVHRLASITGGERQQQASDWDTLASTVDQHVRKHK